MRPVINHHDLVAGQERFQSAAQAQSIIPGVQECRDGGHGVSAALK
jgi:hypothetical protein